MKIKGRVSQAIIALSFLLQAQFTFAALLNSLSPADQVKVKQGEQVSVSQDIPGKPWPRSTVYQRLKATPEEAAAVFHDFGRHLEYFPRVTRSEVLPFAQANTIDVSYVMDLGNLPFWPHTHLGTESYTTRNKISTYDSEVGKAYLLQWNLIKSDSLLSSDGAIRFEGLKEGDTVLCYDILIVPGRLGAGLLASYAKEDVKRAVKKFVERVELLNVSQKAILDQEVRSLRLFLDPR